MTDTNDRFLKAKHVQELLDIGRSTINLWVSKNILPKPIYLNANCPRWRKSDIDNFIKQKIEESEA